MGIRLTGEVLIHKDENNRYSTYLVGNDMVEDKQEQFFHKISVSFRKGVELKNKAKINIKDGFLTTYRYASNNTNDEGNTIFNYFVKMVVLDFEVIEEGEDGVMKKRNYDKPESSQNFGFGNWNNDDDLPF